MKTEIQNLTQAINRLCDLMEKRAQTPATPKPQVFTNPKPQTRGNLEKVEIELTIESNARPYKGGAGNFYDARTKDGETVSLGVSAQKLSRLFAAGEKVLLLADKGTPDKQGRPVFWLSAIKHSMATSPQFTPDEDVPDASVFSSETIDGDGSVPF